MNTAGGFILETHTSNAKAGPSSNFDNGESDINGDSISARKLTAKQEIRLMNYLDDAFMEVNRGYNKRHNIETSSVPNIQSFLEKYEVMLNLIASIPPIGPSASLLVSYLLRYTNEIMDGIVGYELGGSAGPSSHDDGLLAQELQKVVDSLSLLDRVWTCVLRGQMVDMNAVKRNIDRARDESDDLFPHARLEEQVEGLGDADRDTGRYPPIQPSKSEREGRSIIGSKGFATVAQTHRIRLRNLVALGKENLFTWMRVQLDVPLPPRVDAEKDAELEQDSSLRKADGNGHVQVSRDGNGLAEMVKIEDEEDGDLEEVDTNSRSHKFSAEFSMPKQDSHYENLFARKIDPDASDVDSNGENSDAGREENGKHYISSSVGEQSLKRPRQDVRNPRETSSTSGPEDAESIATFSGTATVMKWDVKFARLFSHTLRCLSDIQEYSNHRDAARQGQEAQDDT